MKFISPNAGYKLVIVPTDYEWVRGNTRRTLKGIRVEFAGGFFDTDVAAAQLGWSPDDKELVEKTMLQNADFGARYFLADKDTEAVLAPHREEYMEDTEDALASLDTMCAVTFQTPEGAVPCGNKAVGGTDYCRAHQRIAEKVGEKV